MAPSPSRCRHDHTTFKTKSLPQLQFHILRNYISRKAWFLRRTIAAHQVLLMLERYDLSIPLSNLSVGIFERRKLISDCALAQSDMSFHRSDTYILTISSKAKLEQWAATDMKAHTSRLIRSKAFHMT